MTRARAATSQVRHLNRDTKRPLGISPGFSEPAPRGGCKFIAGDDFAHVLACGGDPYCGKATVAGSAYCEEHKKRCYTREKGPAWVPKPKPRHGA